MNQLTEDSEDNILYELLVFSEWCQDPDVIVRYISTILITFSIDWYKTDCIFILAAE